MDYDLKPCPFYGGKGHIKHKCLRFIGKNYIGMVKERRSCYVQCGACKARGGPFTMMVIKLFGKISEHDRQYMERFAAENWNSRRPDNAESSL